MGIKHRHWLAGIMAMVVLGIGLGYTPGWSAAPKGTGSSQRGADRRGSGDIDQGMHFMMEVQGVGQVLLVAVENLGSEHEIVEHRLQAHRGEPMTQKIPGRLRTAPTTVVANVTKDNALWQWRQQVIDGDFRNAKAMCTITMTDQNGEPVKTWDLTNTWPSGLFFHCSEEGTPRMTLSLISDEILVDGLSSGPMREKEPTQPAKPAPTGPTRPGTPNKGPGAGDL